MGKLKNSRLKGTLLVVLKRIYTTQTDQPFFCGLKIQNEIAIVQGSLV